MKEYIVIPGQSLFDIAVAEYGNVSGVTWLIADNSEIKGPTDRLYDGQVLTIRTDVISIRTKHYLQDHPVIATIAAEDMPEGIGFWSLGEYEISDDLAFLSVDFVEQSENAYRIDIMINKTGVYVVTMTNTDTSETQTYPPATFIENYKSGFGYFGPGTWNVQVGSISVEIEIPN